MALTGRFNIESHPDDFSKLARQNYFTHWVMNNYKKFPNLIHALESTLNTDEKEVFINEINKSCVNLAASNYAAVQQTLIDQSALTKSDEGNHLLHEILIRLRSIIKNIIEARYQRVSNKISRAELIMQENDLHKSNILDNIQKRLRMLAMQLIYVESFSNGNGCQELVSVIIRSTEHGLIERLRATYGSIFDCDYTKPDKELPETEKDKKKLCIAAIELFQLLAGTPTGLILNRDMEDDYSFELAPEISFIISMVQENLVELQLNRFMLQTYAMKNTPASSPPLDTIEFYAVLLAFFKDFAVEFVPGVHDIKLRILVVDDEKDNRKQIFTMFKIFLINLSKYISEGLGATVIIQPEFDEAANGEEAVEKIQIRKALNLPDYDICFLDNSMGLSKWPGFLAAKKIKEISNPFPFLVSFTTDTEVGLNIYPDADTTIVKPVLKKLFQRTIVELSMYVMEHKDKVSNKALAYILTNFPFTQTETLPKDYITTLPPTPSDGLRRRISFGTPKDAAQRHQNDLSSEGSSPASSSGSSFFNTSLTTSPSNGAFGTRRTSGRGSPVILNELDSGNFLNLRILGRGDSLPDLGIHSDLGSPDIVASPRGANLRAAPTTPRESAAATQYPPGTPREDLSSRYQTLPTRPPAGFTSPEKKTVSTQKPPAARRK